MALNDVPCQNYSLKMFLLLLVLGGQDLAFEGDNSLQPRKQYRGSD
jgi:hypothetical protein